MPSTQGPIEQALNILRDAMVPFVEKNLARNFPGSNWFDQVNRLRVEKKQLRKDPTTKLIHWTPDALLDTITIHNWDAFKFSFKSRDARPISNAEGRFPDFVARGWVQELLELRNRAAHERGLTQHEVFRFVDTAQLLLRAAYCAEAADALRDIVPGKAYLEVNYPAQYDTDFMSARELWMTGTNMRRIVTGHGSTRYLDCIKTVLAKNGIVKVLMNHPDDDVCRYAMMQDGPNTDLQGYRQVVGENLNTFCKIRDTVRNGKTNMSIRTINYMLTFGLDVMNGKDDTRGVAYVRFYPLPKKHENLDDRPIVRLSPHDATWYNFFIGQFERHWNNGENRGYAVDVPAGYVWTPQ
jgi:hypothetical protein